MRFSAVENVEDGGVVLEEMLKVAKWYEEAGADILNVSQGWFTETVPAYCWPEALNIEYAAAVKKVVDVPVFCAGRITSPEMAEKFIADGLIDFVAIGRGQLADPDYVTKVMEGRTDEIVRCIACDQGCIERLYTRGLGASCVFNPAAVNEAEVVIKEAQTKKNILVIGGGPAGLEAARVAAERGHRVTLFEKTVNLGGQYLLAGYAPLKRDFTEAAVHMGYRAMKAGVDVKVYTEATEDRIRDLNPDEIIIAAGSHTFFPPINSIDHEMVYDARKVIGAEQYISANEVVVIGGGLVGLEAAEILACQGKSVSVVEMMDQVGKEIEIYVQPYIRETIAKHNIHVYTSTKCVEIRDGELVGDKNGEEVVIPCQAVIVASGAKSNTEVEELVKTLGIPYHVVGDAKKPGKVLSAIWSGNEIARNI